MWCVAYSSWPPSSRILNCDHFTAEYTEVEKRVISLAPGTSAKMKKALSDVKEVSCILCSKSVFDAF